jgi:hypothetical protein
MSRFSKSLFKSSQEVSPEVLSICEMFPDINVDFVRQLYYSFNGDG